MRKSPRRLVLALLAGAALLVAGSFWVAHAAPRPAAYLTWYGQSCFLLESASGTRVVMDPIPSNIGYLPPADLHADAVTVSHEHPDHNNVALVRVKDISIRSVGVYHDNKKGAEIGLNTVFVFEVGGVRIAHLGDLGHILTDEQISAIGSVDVVLVPVGGVWTVDAHKATEVVDQIRPRLVTVPMHYHTDPLTIKELATVDGFLAGRSNVRHETGTRLAITGLRSRPSAETVVLRYQ